MRAGPTEPPVGSMLWSPTLPPLRRSTPVLFGWDIQDGPPEAGGHLMCMLNGRPVAAISPKPEEIPFPNVWSTYLAADDLDATVAKANAKAKAKAKAAGGQFMMEPMDVMTAGRIAFGMDPTGAPMASGRLATTRVWASTTSRAPGVERVDDTRLRGCESLLRRSIRIQL